MATYRFLMFASTAEAPAAELLDAIETSQEASEEAAFVWARGICPEATFIYGDVADEGFYSRAEAAGAWPPAVDSRQW